MNPSNGASGVGSPSDANQIANNTMEAFGLMAYLALLANSMQSNVFPSNIQDLIDNAVAQLKSLLGSVGPNSNCAADIQNALKSLNGSLFQNYLKFWNNPQPPQTSVLTDAFNWMTSSNYNSASNGANSDIGFYETMVFLSIQITPGASQADEGNFDAMLRGGGSGPSGAALLESFLLNYAYNQSASNPDAMADLLFILPPPAANDDGTYKAFLTQINADSSTWAQNQGLPPAGSTEMEALLLKSWENWADCLPPNNS